MKAYKVKIFRFKFIKNHPSFNQKLCVKCFQGGKVLVLATRLFDVSLWLRGAIDYK